MSHYFCRIFPHKIAKLKREKYEKLVAKSPQTYFVEEKKKPRISLKNLFHLKSNKKYN